MLLSVLGGIRRKSSRDRKPTSPTGAATKPGNAKVVTRNGAKAVFTSPFAEAAMIERRAGPDPYPQSPDAQPFADVDVTQVCNAMLAVLCKLGAVRQYCTAPLHS